MVSVVQSERMRVQSDQDVVLVRQTVRRLTQDLAFSLVDQTKMVTAASELARNTVVYGGGGELQWEVLAAQGRGGLRLTFVDRGPGIADLRLALTDGWSSGDGLGMGLSGARRLVHEFTIDSAPGRGTTVSILRWK
jgi:serine/threonine-protein kinase RsbT